MTTYKDKYLKYKNKYLELKGNLYQIGGLYLGMGSFGMVLSNPSINFEPNTQIIQDPNIDLSYYKDKINSSNIVSKIFKSSSANTTNAKTEYYNYVCLIKRNKKIITGDKYMLPLAYGTIDQNHFNKLCLDKEWLKNINSDDLNIIKNTQFKEQIIFLHLWRFKTPILMKIKNLFFIFF